MRKMKTDYPLHGCSVCGTPTQYKTMCDKHLRIAIKIPYMPTEQERRTWESEPEPSPRYRRQENNDKLR